MIKLFGYNENRAGRIAIRYGKRHGKKNLAPQGEAVVVRIIKSRPEDDPAKDAQLAQWYAGAQPHPEREQWDRTMRTTLEENTKHTNVWLLRLAAIFLLLAEFLGVSNLLAHQGMENPERTILALAGACILFYLTKKAAEHHIAAPRAQAAPKSNVTPITRKKGAVR